MTDGVGSLVRYFAEAHPEETARRLEGLEAREAARILESLSVKQGGEILGRLNPAFGSMILRMLPADLAGRLLGLLPLRAATALILPMDAEGREGLLRSLSEGEGRRLREQLAYAPDTAG